MASPGPVRQRIVELCALIEEEDDDDKRITLIQELLTLLPEDPCEAMVVLQRSPAGRKFTGSDVGAMT